MERHRVARILYLEPFNAGSHAAFTRALTTGLPHQWTALTLPGRHWKWRMRGAVPYLATVHRDTLSAPYDLVIASSYVPLAELRGLAPNLAAMPNLLYFHENQLTYPVQEAHSGPRDHHFGFTQLVSALAATRVAFNSQWNRDSFLDAGRELLRRMPDARPDGMMDTIADRSIVLPVPLDLPPVDAAACVDDPNDDRAAGPIVLWNHRWEYDKNPEGFFGALRELDRREVPFRVIVCGERFKQAPAVFDEARGWLGPRLLHFGYAASREAYRALLHRAHLAVSTAHHEFFGIAMLEAAHFGARPVVPDRLSYPELFPAPWRYADDAALVDTLERLCRGWASGALSLRAARPELTAAVLAPAALARFSAELDALLARSPHG